MASLRDVAKLAGVSISTASKVLNTRTEIERISAECIERVRRAAHRLGYRPNYHARSLLTGKSLALGVALEIREGVNVLGEGYFGSILGGIEATARRAGYDLLFVGAGHGMRAADRALEHLRQHRVDAVINLGWLSEASHRRLVAERTAPIVLVGYAQVSPLPRVDIDDAAGVRQAVQHLLELGHRSLLWLAPGSVEGSVPPAAIRRREAFDSAVRCAGALGEHVEFPVPSAFDSTAMRDAACEALRPQLKSPSFTAVVCYNDLTAAGALHAIFQAGLRVPQNLSVVGFDDLHAACLSPPLTTVDHRLFDLGARAAAISLEMIEKPYVRTRYRAHLDLLEPRLVVRSSTAPPAGAPRGRKD